MCTTDHAQQYVDHLNYHRLKYNSDRLIRICTHDCKIPGEPLFVREVVNNYCQTVSTNFGNTGYAKKYQNDTYSTKDPNKSYPRINVFTMKPENMPRNLRARFESLKLSRLPEPVLRAKYFNKKGELRHEPWREELQNILESPNTDDILMSNTRKQKRKRIETDSSSSAACTSTSAEANADPTSSAGNCGELLYTAMKHARDCGKDGEREALQSFLEAYAGSSTFSNEAVEAIWAQYDTAQRKRQKSR